MKVFINNCLLQNKIKLKTNILGNIDKSVFLTCEDNLLDDILLYEISMMLL